MSEAEGKATHSMLEDPSSESLTRQGGATQASGFPIDRYHSLTLRFLNRLKVSGKSPHTIAAYRNDLGQFSRFLRDLGVDPTNFGMSPSLDELWDGYLSSHGRSSPASRRRAQMSVRTFFHFLVEAEVISGSPLLSTRSPSQPQGHLFCVQPAHFRKLCRHLDSLAKLGDRKALRDLALVLVLGHAGLKASEAAALRWEDVHLPPPKPKSSGGRLIVRNAEKVRMVPLDVQTHRTLLAHRQAVCQEHNPQLVNDSEPLGSLSVFFGYQNMTRRPSLKAMQRHSVKFILYELCRDILDIPYNSESFRNHAILGWLGKGYDSERVADLAGYASLQSLERFLTSSSTLDANRRRRETRPRTRTDERTGHAETDRSLRDP